MSGCLWCGCDSDFNALFQNCHELEKMDLEECVQVNKAVVQVPGVAGFLARPIYEKAVVMAGCHVSFACRSQITDGTLIQLSIHCPRLQVLVSWSLCCCRANIVRNPNSEVTNECVHKMQVGFIAIIIYLNISRSLIFFFYSAAHRVGILCREQGSKKSTEWYKSVCMCLLAEPFSLWADHRRRHPTPGQRAMRPRPPGGDRAGQLPADHRRLAGAPEELPQSGPHRALRLPADHPSRHQETTGEWRTHKCWST